MNAQHGSTPQTQGYQPPIHPHGNAQQGDAQGYAPPGQPQGYAPGAFAPPPSTGVRHWAWQLLYWVPVPLVSLLIVPLVLLGLRGSAVRNGGADEANSRGAINWSLTWLVAVLVTGALHFVLLFTFGRDGGVPGGSPEGIVLGITTTLTLIAFFGGGVLTLINLIRGWSAANRGEAARPWLAIPFFRAARPVEAPGGVTPSAVA